MNPFEDFNHFIAYFVPGIGLFLVALASVSLFEGSNSLLRDPNFLVILVGSTIAGLFLDEARHVWLEEWLERRWAQKNGIDLTALEDFLAYVPTLGVDLYKLIRDEHYYYYEFDINMSLVLIPGSIVAAMYLSQFQILTNWAPTTFVGVTLLAMAPCFWKFGIDAYEYFLNTFVDTLARKDDNFRKSIGREKRP